LHHRIEHRQFAIAEALGGDLIGVLAGNSPLAHHDVKGLRQQVSGGLDP